jgi:hypothetical protein
MKKLLLAPIFLICFITSSANSHDLLYLNKNKLANNDYTYCYQAIAVTLFAGGNAKQVRYGANRTILKTVTGEWTAYGSPSDVPGQTIKILFNGDPTEYSYTLIRNGYGDPSVLIDGMGRRYTLCKTQKSMNSGNENSNSDKFMPYLTDEAINRINKAYDNKKIPSLDIFVGWWSSENEETLFSIKKIPYPFAYAKAYERMNYLKNEKKISLELIILQNGKQVFKGVSLVRDNDPITKVDRVEFYSNDTCYGIYLNGIYSDGTKYKPKISGTLTEPDYDRIIFLSPLKEYVIKKFDYEAYQKNRAIKQNEINQYGGYIFYILKDGDNGYDPKVKKGYVIAPSDLMDEKNNTLIRWQEEGKGFENFYTSNSMGSGKSNTEKILSKTNCSNCAAKLCTDFRGGGFTDWYLPSDLELNEALGTLVRNKDFNQSRVYWSSSENNMYSVLTNEIRKHSSGFIYVDASADRKEDMNYVRPIRYFEEKLITKPSVKTSTTSQTKSSSIQIKKSN